MARKIIGNLLDRIARNNINSNFEELYNDVGNISGKITDEVYDEIRNDVNLIWKPPVATQADLPTDATTGDTRMSTDTGSVYRYNGSEWIEIQQLNPDAITEVDNRLQTEIDTKETTAGAQTKADTAETDAKAYTDNLRDRVYDPEDDVVKVVERGSDNNGRYVRYSDGKQEVFFEPVSIASNNEYSNIYRSDPTVLNYPVPFDNNYHVYGDANVTSSGIWANVYVHSNGEALQVQLYSAWSNAAFSTYVHAVGRWK